MPAIFRFSAEQFDALIRAMESYGDGAAERVNEVIHTSGSTFSEAITPLIHPSMRTWRGKPESATRGSWPFYDTSKDLQIDVTTKSKYHYLYFPDDGGNSRRHAGHQRFFERGGEKAVPRVIEKCQEALIKAWEDAQ